MDQQLIKAGHEVVSDDIVTGVQNVVTEYNINASQLLQQAERAVVDSDETLATAGDLAKIIRGQEKKAEDARKGLIAPVRGFLETVNALFKTSASTRAKAKGIIEKKAGEFQRKRQEEARIAAEAARKEAEERALRDAEAQQAAGDEDGANTILDFGAKAAEKIERQAAPALVRGNYGSTVGSRRDVTGAVTDHAAFLRAIADGKAGDWRDLVVFRTAGLNALARKAVDGNLENPIPGFVAKVESKVSFK